MQFLRDSRILASIADRRPSVRLDAAVAYVGADAPLLMPFRRGDVLVFNGSENALANGATSADAIGALHRRKVKLFAHQKLHAKVYVVGHVAIIGSANLSVRAATDGTAEAAIETDDVSIVKEALAFITDVQRDAESVDEAWLDWATS